MKLIQTWGKVQRPWGIELRADFDDGQGGIINEVMNFEREPNQAEIDRKVEEIKVRLEAIKPELQLMAMENPEVVELKKQVVALQAEIVSLKAVKPPVVIK